MSIAAGLYRAFERLREVEGQALQIFLRNQRQWESPPISPSAAEQFIASWLELKCPPVAAHDSYLVNLASSDSLLAQRSIDAFADEIRSAARLRIPYLVTHPGAHVGAGTEVGLERFVRNMDQAIALADAASVMVLIENSAGQGTQLGSRFEEIAFILERSGFSDRLGMCLDTAHAFAAGYDFRTAETYTRTFSELDHLVGLNRLKFFHLNDSKKKLATRVDRHEHIGRGAIGLEAFRLLLNDARFAGLPMVLETPKGKDLQEDRENLRVLRSLLQPASEQEDHPSVG